MIRRRPARSSMRLVVAHLGACVVATASGCIDEDTIRDYIARQETCPPDRVDVKKRPDLDAVSYGLGAPSPEAAVDPGRAAYRRELQAEQLGGRTVYEVTACGLHELIACRARRADGRTYFRMPECVGLPPTALSAGP